MRLILAALLASTALADSLPALDKAALEPVLTMSWTSGGSCDADITDFVIDTDGQPYIRTVGSFTPLTSIALQAGDLTIVDEIGIGRTTTIYKLGADKTLRLWSEYYDPNFGNEPEPGAPAEEPMERVKDGLIVIDETGAPQAAAPTVPMTPCPARASVYPAEIITALEGTWATGDGKGGICARDADSVTFQLSRPVPHVLRGPFGGEVSSTSYALAIAAEGEAYVVTEGNAFEAGDYTFTPDGKGGLVQANPYADGPLELHRCP
ncbi:MAG: hypothetical protein QM698_10330 [Micropepsaceae bacterium]